MQAHSTNFQKGESGLTPTAKNKGGRKREPISADMLAGMTAVLINEALMAGLPIRTAKSRAGGLLIALDALTLDDDGRVIVMPAGEVTHAPTR